MIIIVAGGDGFCGWPTALHLSQQGHKVAIVDSLVRRKIDDELRSGSVTPIASLKERVAAWKELTGRDIAVYEGDLNHYDFLAEVFHQVRPEAFVHFAEQRSAPYSMIDRDHALYQWGFPRLLAAVLAGTSEEERPVTHVHRLPVRQSRTGL